MARPPSALAVECAVTFVGLTVAGVVAQPVRVRRLTDQEGQKLQRIDVPCPPAGNRVPVVAKLVQVDEGTVRAAHEQLR